MCASIWTTKDVQVLQQALQKHRGDWPNLLKMLPGFTQKQIQNKIGHSQRDKIGMPDGKEAKREREHECEITSLDDDEQEDRDIDKRSHWDFTFQVHSAECFDDEHNCDIKAWFCFDDGDWSSNDDADGIYGKRIEGDKLWFDCFSHAKKHIRRSEKRAIFLVLMVNGEQRFSTQSFWLGKGNAPRMPPKTAAVPIATKAVDPEEADMKEKRSRAAYKAWETRRKKQKMEEGDSDSEDGAGSGSGSGSADAAPIPQESKAVVPRGEKRKEPPAPDVQPPAAKRPKWSADVLIEKAMRDSRVAQTELEDQRKQMLEIKAQTEQKRQDLTKAVAARIVGTLNSMTFSDVTAIAEDTKQQAKLLQERDDNTSHELQQCEVALAERKKKIKEQALEQLAKILDTEM